MSDPPAETIPTGPILPQPPPLEPGAELGPFRIIALLGEGGMGRVFVAEDVRLGRKVALKVMLPSLAKDERARKMFLREARSAAAVGHDRVVSIHEADEAAGVPYIAMELLAGEPLDKYLARTPRPPLAVALAVARQVAEGLAAAHAHENTLIHRDVKPANVWLRATPGQTTIDVRLLDFGLARAAGGDTLSTGTAGKVVGTPSYMAPEQWDGKGVDHQSDVFSLGVMLYQMLTGRTPFRGGNVRELMFQICMPAVVPDPPDAVDPAIPAELSAFVMRMIAKDKAERVKSAAEVMRVLARLCEAGAGDASAPAERPGPAEQLVPLVSAPSGETHRRRRRPMWLAAGVPVLLIAAVAGFFAGEPAKVGPPPPPLDCTGPAGAAAAEVQQAQRAWADYLGVPVEYRVDLGGGAGMDFVLVPPGRFVMGTTDEELDALEKVFPKFVKGNYTNETPRHEVAVTRPMYVGKTEVTRGQFARFPAADSNEGAKPDWGDDTHPVVNVSRNGAKAFAAEVGGKPLPKGFGTVRLPREAEWEYACRAGTRTRFPNGADDPETLAKIGNVADASYKKDNAGVNAVAADDGFAKTAPAGAYAANRFGLHDMIGNVWEWCEDGYDTEAYKSHDAADAFVKPITGSHVLRGGVVVQRPGECPARGPRPGRGVVPRRQLRLPPRPRAGRELDSPPHYFPQRSNKLCGTANWSQTRPTTKSTMSATDSGRV